jgi:hypothetical protein
MAAASLNLFPAAATEVVTGGQAVTAVFAGAAGGQIMNPASAADQGIDIVESLFYSFTGPAGTVESATTFPLQPGQILDIPAGMTTGVSVNAVSSGHKFSGYILQPPSVVTLLPTIFPPSAPPFPNTIPAVLYKQYRDDDNLQGYFSSHNGLMQQYVTLFNQIGLPVYTNPLITGALLDLVAIGLYGISRPTLSSNNNQILGPYNTAALNTLAFNQTKVAGNNVVTVTTDDIFKRILTWSLYRGDGKQFNVKWLKRRILRFLNGVNGTDVVIDQTYSVSVSYGANRTINIVLPNVALAPVLQEAIGSQATPLPFQYNYDVSISTD